MLLAETFKIIKTNFLLLNYTIFFCFVLFHCHTHKCYDKHTLTHSHSHTLMRSISHRRTMGLPPAQGHNNLRLTNTAKLYQYQNNLRLDRTQFTPIKQTHYKPYPRPFPFAKSKFKHNTDSHPFLSSLAPPPPPSFSSSSLLRKHVLYHPMPRPRPPYPPCPPPVSILKPPHRTQSFYQKHFDNQHVQFAPTHNRIAQRKTFYSYPNRRFFSIPSYSGSTLASSSAAIPSIALNNRHSNMFVGKKVRMKVLPKLNLPSSSLSSLSSSYSKQRRQQCAQTTHPSRTHTIVSNMPLINVNSSVVMVNHSPFGLRDPRFGIFHHCSQSISYF